jgi:monooxygenase
MSGTSFDVLIIGAGLAGIGTAARIARDCPDWSMALLERREALGGTWDLFRYPGVRSDTDMYSYGYSLRPWQSPKLLGDGATIRQYIGETAREFHIDDKIHYGLKIIHAHWSSIDQNWTLDVQHIGSGEMRYYSCRFLVGCTGYYNQDEGFLPKFPGQEGFKGRLIHPQQWPDDLDYEGKCVVVIGSGATAITLVPAMADKTAHITMLQRSPTYIVSLPGTDTLSLVLSKFLPASPVYRFARKRYIWLQRGFYLACRRWPEKLRKIVLAQVRKQVGEKIDMKHFTPSYMPWDQRVCVVPDADLFEQIKAGHASVVTDQIETFNETGIRLHSGQQLDADIIVAATGLNLQMLGGIEISVDGVPKQLNQLMTYKSVLLQDIPNFAWVFGGGNTPWTLRVELVAQYICRLLQHMRASGKAVAVAHDDEHCQTDTSILGELQSGYVQRGDALLPRQGSKYPWRLAHHLGKDTQMLLGHPIEDRWLHFYEARKPEAEHVRA